MRYFVRENKDLLKGRFMDKNGRQKKAKAAVAAMLIMTIVFSSQQVSAKEQIQVQEEGLKSIIQVLQLVRIHKRQ